MTTKHDCTDAGTETVAVAQQQLVRPTPPSQYMMLIVGKNIVMLSRKKRSKWFEITCAGCPARLRRKDGTCRHERIVLDNVNPKIKHRTRIVSSV